MIADKFCVNEQYVKNNWDKILDFVAKDKPVFIKKDRDNIVLLKTSLALLLLEDYKLHADIKSEADETITITLHEFEIVVNAKSESVAIENVLDAIIQYAEQYYDSFEIQSSEPNREVHMPFVLKVLLLNDKDALRSNIEWKYS